MNRKVFYGTMAIVATVMRLVACSHEELTGQGTILPERKYPLILTNASVAGTTRATTEDEWEGGETIRVQVVDNYVSGEPQWDKATSQTYTVVEAASMTKSEGDPEVYWNSPSEKKAIRAWYVGGTTASSSEFPSSHTVETDQNTVGNYEKSDFLFAQRDADFTNDNDGISLHFYHQVAKIKVVVNGGLNDEFKDPSVTYVAIENVATTGTFTAPVFGNKPYGTWKIDETSIKTIMLNLKPAPKDVTCEAIVIPQTISSGRLKFTIQIDDDTTYTFTPKEVLNWDAGYEYTYGISMPL